jgi:hypothetical protein
MTALHIILSIIGILFVIWLYALVLSENMPRPNLSKLYLWWHEYRQKSFFQKIRSLIHAFFSFLQLCLRTIKGIFKFILEVIVESLFYIILRIIWVGIKLIFHFIGRIFD